VAGNGGTKYGPPSVAVVRILYAIGFAGLAVFLAGLFMARGEARTVVLAAGFFAMAKPLALALMLTCIKPVRGAEPEAAGEQQAK
jgi:hypothetical protein